MSAATRAARIEDEVAARRARGARPTRRGSILVFLPGQGEIRRVAALLAERGSGDPTSTSRRSTARWTRARRTSPSRPPPPGRRKIVLATSIAETSLTIEGVRVVIDSGLMRVPRFEPDIGLTRLETVRVSRANADQRRGRAGRVEPGVCYRLWEEAANGGARALCAAGNPVRRSLRLRCSICALWGVADPRALAFLDPPPRAALAEARALLTAIGALDARRPHHRRGPGDRAARAAAAARAHGGRRRARRATRDRRPRSPSLLTERGLGGDARRPDDRGWTPSAATARRARRTRAGSPRRLRATRPRRPAPSRGTGRAAGGRGGRAVGALLASAFPDRIARRAASAASS